jgi:hypothetical protein
MVNYELQDWEKLFGPPQEKKKNSNNFDELKNTLHFFERRSRGA